MVPSFVALAEAAARRAPARSGVSVRARAKMQLDTDARGRGRKAGGRLLMADHGTKTPPGESRPETFDETEPKTPSDDSTRRLWIIWTAAVVVAIGVFVVDWMWQHPSVNTLEFEVAKASLQALAVALIAGLVTIATTKFTHHRQRITEKAQKDHEEFERRVAILDRASGCAQKMFASCEHLRLLHVARSPKRIQVTRSPKRLQVARSPKRAKRKELAEARALLDKAYVEFYLDAEGLLLELGARYGNDEAGQAAPGDNKAKQAAPEDETTEQVKKRRNAYKQWQKIEYLLIVYYLILC